MIRRVIIGMLLTALVAGGILLVVFFDDVKETARGVASDVAQAVKGTIEQWTRDQIVRIARAHLGVEFTFDEFEFVSSDTVRLTGVYFSEHDQPFIECDSLTVTFARIPAWGEPIQIQRARAESPEVRLIAREDGSLLGWPNLIRANEGEQFDDGGSTKVSDVFAIRRIEIAQGFLEYRPAGDRPAMRFEGLTMGLDVEPDPSGWYGLAAHIDRAPLVDLSIDGRLNLDTGDLDVQRSVVNALLARDQYAIFPPDIQEFFASHEIDGRLALNLSGSVPLSDPARFQIGGDLVLTNTRFVAGNAQFPIDSLTARLDLNHDRMQLHSVDAQLLGGTAALSGSVAMNETFDAALEYSFDNIELRRAVRETAGGETSLAGLTDLQGSASASFASLLDTLTTRGDLHVERGRLVRVPVISALIGKAKGDPNKTGSDTLTSTYSITSDSPRILKLRDIDLVSGAIAARGEGEIAFDGRINYRLNAGPLERVQGLLGPVGDILGAVTDQFVKYEVSGTLKEPVVSVRPLGIGTGELGKGD